MRQLVEGGITLDTTLRRTRKSRGESMKFLYFGDPHIRGTNPRNRKDNYKEALIAKFREIFALAKYKGVTAIIEPGDTFDRPEVTTSVLLEFARVLKESPVPIYTTAGNHDIYGYNLATYERTSLRVLELIVPQLTVINDPGQAHMFHQDGNHVQLTFTPYSDQIDKAGYGYSPEVIKDYESTKIHIAHGMLLDHDPPFDRYTKVQDVKTEADLVLCGHDHTGFGIYNRSDGKVFANIGSITRLSASEAEISRPIQVLLIDVKSPGVFDLERIPFQSAKTGEEVLDRSRIEAEKKRAYAMEEFASLIQTETGEDVLVDINTIVESIAKTESINSDVVEIALTKIAEAKEGLRA
ncbi:metallophosphoesterase family protein [Bacillus sp. FSL K6-0067]|uniref:metallophosphoesterase family protein n=1 Tax=Bacillus sp. FSL K6-0067 TaxID=2921412 RepID=UPI000B0069B9|nr:metallophosphoesterase [Bacillus cereus]